MDGLERTSEPTGKGGQRNRSRQPSFWLPATMVGLAVHGAAFFALGISSGHREAHPGVTRGILWEGERADEAIEVRDPKPIFLPTKWNATARESSQSDSREPGDIFGLQARAPLVEKASSPAGLVVMPDGAKTASVAIREFGRPYFSAFGQEDQPMHRVPARVAGIEVRIATSGEVVLKWELTTEQTEAAGAEAKRWPPWQPFEMLIAVEPTGMVGLPLIAAPGSGADIVDEFFRTNLRGLLQPDLALPAGYYRVLVGP